MGEPVKIPTMIDQPETILLWEADEFVPVAVLFVLGFIVKQIILSIILGYVFTKVIRKYKDVRPDGFMLHWLYWIGISSEKGHTIRNSFIKTFRH